MQTAELQLLADIQKDTTLLHILTRKLKYVINCLRIRKPLNINFANIFLQDLICV